VTAIRNTPMTKNCIVTMIAASPSKLDSVEGCNLMTIQSTSTKLSMIVETLISSATFLTSIVTSWQNEIWQQTPSLIGLWKVASFKRNVSDIDSDVMTKWNMTANPIFNWALKSCFHCKISTSDMVSSRYTIENNLLCIIRVRKTANINVKNSL